MLAVLAPLLILLAVPSSAATQDATPAAAYHRAGLVVRHGDGRLTYALVPFTENEMSGIDLLERSTVEIVTVPFGALGEGVCSLDGEGCGVTECRRRVCQGSGAAAPFWQVFRQTVPGDWRSLPLGASSMRVRDGDVVGWSWTGRDANLPALTLADVARVAGAPEGASLGAEDPLPLAAVETVYPPGVDPSHPGSTQDPMTYAVAVGLLAAIGGAGVYVVRRRRPVPRPERAA